MPCPHTGSEIALPVCSMVFGLGGSLDPTTLDKWDRVVRDVFDGTANYPGGSHSVLDYTVDPLRLAGFIYTFQTVDAMGLPCAGVASWRGHGRGQGYSNLSRLINRTCCCQLAALTWRILGAWCGLDAKKRWHEGAPPQKQDRPPSITNMLVT